jgi:hypothetical protein
MMLIHFLLGLAAICLLVSAPHIRAPYDWAMITAGALIVGFLALTK